MDDQHSAGHTRHPGNSDTRNLTDRVRQAGIIEGVTMLRTLQLAGLRPDFLVMVTNLACEPNEEDAHWQPPRCLSTEVEAYLDEYRPQDRAGCC
jgi:hypothetical protein